MIYYLVGVGTPLTQGKTFYVNSFHGADSHSGTSPENAWRTLDRVHSANLLPGDRVLFLRGGLWRGQLKPTSGTPGKPIYYGAYGEGPVPVIYGSICVNRPEDWIQVSPDLWVTRKTEPTPVNNMTFLDTVWKHHSEAGAHAKITTNPNGFSLYCSKSGTAKNHIQVWGPALNRNIPRCILLTFKARSSIPFTLDPFYVQNAVYPWNHWMTPQKTSLNLTSEWKEFSLILLSSQARSIPEKEIPRLHLNLGLLPAGCTLEVRILKAQSAILDTSRTLPVDVGNIIMAHKPGDKPTCGVKKWNLHDLKDTGDYWYDAEFNRVFLRCTQNPGARYGLLELALRRHGVDQSNCHDVIYEDLGIRYAAAHGFGGGNTERITIRRCEILYIGGGHQLTRPDGKPVRFGNGIEFWNCCCDSLVEECRIGEIYDAALTNQGKGNSQNPSIQRNIIYRNNLIWNAEYSYEYWNGDASQRTENILFTKNICHNAGSGWGHAQRPDQNGAHLMFYNNPAKTSHFIISENVFSESTEVSIRMDSDWRKNLTLKNNIYKQKNGKVVRFMIKNYENSDLILKNEVPAK